MESIWKGPTCEKFYFFPHQYNILNRWHFECESKKLVTNFIFYKCAFILSSYFRHRHTLCTNFYISLTLQTYMHTHSRRESERERKLEIYEHDKVIKESKKCVTFRTNRRTNENRMKSKISIYKLTNLHLCVISFQFISYLNNRRVEDDDENVVKRRASSCNYYFN
jgi:hypothetical protein